MDKFHSYILNTNNLYRPEDEQEMLNQEVCGTFCENSHKIGKINVGDIVFLYKKQVGIIGYGTASGVVIVKDRIRPENGQFVANGSQYQKLNDFSRLEKPLSAKGIKDVLGRYVPFTNTIFKLREGEGTKIIAHLENATT